MSAVYGRFARHPCRSTGIRPGLVVVGALVGIALAKRMPQQLFDRLVIVLTVLGAVYLLF